MDFIKITLLAIIMIFVGNIENRISDMASNFGGNGASICEESNQLKTSIKEGNSKQAGEEIE